ncbi:MAG: ABC transporter ATP-binding protein [Mangrovicoccus sp.]
MIDVKIAGKSFGSERILGSIRLTVEQGESVAILGPSGVGKSTLLRIIAGLDTKFEGSISDPGPMGMVFQEPVLLPWRSCLRNLTLVHPEQTDDEARLMLQRVGLVGKEGLFPGQLSLGQQRRLALARAFMGRPKLLIMDEPFVSLDPATAETMLLLTESLLAELRPALIFVTHAREEATRLADRILTLSGSPAVLRAEG